MGEIRLKRIEFAGGGTAGHLFPALALAQAFSRACPQVEISFWGTRRGIEYRLREYLGHRLRLIRIRGFQRRWTAYNLLVPFQLLFGIAKAIAIMAGKRPDLVVGTGGYVSAPVVLAAVLLRIPVALHEQNSTPGMATRMLAGWARRIYLTYPGSADFFKHADRIATLGNPIREFDRSSGIQLEDLKLDPNRKTVFVFGGSQGAMRLNQVVETLAPELLNRHKIQFLWATGPAHFERLSATMGNLDFIKLFAFLQDIHVAYMAADLVVCRAGATTIAELTALGVPAILIPLPHSAGGHQLANARELERAGAAICLPEEEMSAEKLGAMIVALLNDRDRLQNMKANVKQLGRPDAAHTIVSDILNTLFSDREN